MEITEVKIYPFDTRGIGGRVRAIAHIILDNQLIIKDIKLIQNKHGGYFISFPKKRTTSGKFVDIVEPLSKELEENIRRVIVDKYKEIMGIGD